MIRFQIAIANPGILPDTHFVAVFINADMNASTGAFGGFEYMIQTGGALGQALVGQWNGDTYAPVEAPSLVKIWVGGGTMTFQLMNSVLGNTTTFTWWAATEILPEIEADWDDVAPGRNRCSLLHAPVPHAASAAARRARYAASRPPLRRQRASPHLRRERASGRRRAAQLAGRAVRGTGRGARTRAPRRAGSGSLSQSPRRWEPSRESCGALSASASARAGPAAATAPPPKQWLSVHSTRTVSGHTDREGHEWRRARRSAKRWRR